MTPTISRVHLFNVERNKSEEAELWDALTKQQVADWEEAWAPALSEAIQHLRQAGDAGYHFPQSSHWNWRKKIEALQGLLAYQGFSIVCNDLTQGMMIVNTTSQRCRVDDQKGQHLVYVAFVENAPWNRAELFSPPRYRGVGSILIRAAIMLSESLEFRGRIGLHSLPQADRFYADTCGMTNLGADPDNHDMCYFEMTPEQAQAFVTKVGSPR